jgi:integrase
VRKSDSQNYQYYTSLVKFLVCTGCRPSEAAGLQWKYITEHDIIFDQALLDSVRGRVLKDGLKMQRKHKFPINEQLREVFSV